MLHFHRGPHSGAIDAVYRELDGPGRPGGIIMVQKGEELLHCAAYGRANQEFDIPWTPQTRFAVASITKSFVADVILQLVDAGRLRLDTPMKDFFPDFGPLAEGVSIEHLLTMSSGFRHEEVAAQVAGAADWTNDYLFDVMKRQTTREFPVGSYQLYCCGGYRLLSSIIEMLTGLDFDAALRKHVFDPLGMASSSARPRWNEIESNRASIYRSHGPGHFLRVQESGESSGDGALVTTMEDLAKFVAYLRRPDGNGISRIERLANVPVLRGGVRGFYGYGLFVDSLEGAPVWGHGGSSNCGYVHLPRDDVTVICFHNSFDLRAATTLEEVARIVTERPSLPVPGNWAGLHGLYGNAESGFLFELMTVKGVPRVSILDDKAVQIRETEPGTYRCTYRPYPFAIQPHAMAGDGRPAMLTTDIDAAPIICLPLAAREPSAGSLDRYAGRYMSAEMFALAEVRVTPAGLLVLLGPGASGSDQLPLVELSDGFFHANGTSVRFLPDGKDGMTMKIGRFRARNFIYGRLNDRSSG